MEFKSATEIPGFLESNPIKLKIQEKWKFGKFEGVTIDLKENNFPLKRKEWKKVLMTRWVDVDGQVFYVRAIEAFALHDDCDHRTIGLVLSKKIAS